MILNKINKKFILIVFCGIIFILITTNPSNNRFKEYLNSKGKSEFSLPIRHREFFPFGRESNYFIFSTFRYGDDEKYFGILENFIPIKNTKKLNQDSINAAEGIIYSTDSLQRNIEN